MLKQKGEYRDESGTGNSRTNRHHHLDPPSILHVSTFVHFCETFLGIELHFDQFLSMYSLIPQPSSREIGLADGASLQLRSGMEDKYLKFPAIHTDINWKDKWFFIGNPNPAFPKSNNEPPEYVYEWSQKSTPGSDDQVKELLDLIWCMRELRVTTASVMFNWTQHRFSLCRSEIILGFSKKVLKIVPDYLQN